MNETSSRWNTAQRRQFLVAFGGVLLIVFLWWVQLPFSFAFDPNDEKCLPDLHLALLILQPPRTVGDGALVVWKPAASLDYVKQEYVLKQVGGVAGDHLVVRDAKVYVNGRLLVSGLPLASLYDKTAAELERDETIPAGKLLVIGTAARSDDSRYWGYLDASRVTGVAYKIF